MTNTRWHLRCSWNYAFIGIYCIHGGGPILRVTDTGLAPGWLEGRSAVICLVPFVALVVTRSRVYPVAPAERPTGFPEPSVN